MKKKKENSKNVCKNTDGTDPRRLPQKFFTRTEFTDMGFISGNQNIDIIDRGCIDPSRVLEPEIKKN